MPWTAILALLLYSLFPAPRLAGTVVDGEGRPVAGAEVRLLSEGRLEASTRTSQAGAFQFLGLTAGGRDLLALAPGFAPERLAVPVRGAGESIPIVLVLRPGRVATGRVLDESERPVAGARVKLSRSRPSWWDPLSGEEDLYRAVTGADGRFELPQVPAGRYDLGVRAAGFAPFRSRGLDIPKGSGATDFGRQVLERGAVVAGRVSDSEGRPVPDAEVWVVPYEMRDTDRDWSRYYAAGPAAKTGPRGEFEIPDLAPGETVDLDICRPGYLSIAWTVPEAPGESVEAVLQPAVHISGRVLDPRGAPVADARLVAWISGEQPDDPRRARPCFRETGSARTGADGGFLLDALRPGWWTVRASAEGWRRAESERRQLRDGESLEGLEIVLGERPPGVVLGRVLLPGGRPAAGAEVSIPGEEDVTAISGGDGAYRLDGIEPGERILVATHPGHEASRNLRVAPGENRVDLTLEPDGLREVRGRVLGPEGEPVAGAEVIPGGFAIDTSAADGSFVVRLPDGTHRIWADREGHAPSETAVVAVDGGPVEGIDLRLPRAGSIRGRLLGLSPEALIEARVEVRLSNTRFSLVDSQGGYRLDGVPAGEWTVLAHTRQRTVEGTARLAPGEEEAVLDLSFEPAWEVSGRLTKPDGGPVAGAWIEARDPQNSGKETYTLPDGSFRMELQDGTYDLEINAWDQGLYPTAGVSRVRVSGGAIQGIGIPMTRATLLRGRIFGLEPGELAWSVHFDGPGGRSTFVHVDQESRYSLMLFPGTWTVTAKYGDREATGRITLEKGQEEAFLDLVFEVE